MESSFFNALKSKNRSLIADCFPQFKVGSPEIITITRIFMLGAMEALTIGGKKHVIISMEQDYNMILAPGWVPDVSFGGDLVMKITSKKLEASIKDLSRVEFAHPLDRKPIKQIYKRIKKALLEVGKDKEVEVAWPTAKEKETYDALEDTTFSRVT